MARTMVKKNGRKVDCNVIGFFLSFSIFFFRDMHLYDTMAHEHHLQVVHRHGKAYAANNKNRRSHSTTEHNKINAKPMRKQIS